MKKICFPVTNRVHLARQGRLLEELRKSFDIKIVSKFEKGDAYIIRGDRRELLPFAMDAAYNEIPIFHIEGGDLSGVLDNKVRYAITHLSDYHFCTNEESHRRLIQNGVPIDRVWNYGSLDVEYAKSVKPKREKKGEYILVTYHPIPTEDENELDRALESQNCVKISSNTDYGRSYGEEEYSPEKYINLIRYAKCMVGNSSSLIKEASILGTPCVLIGERQKNRLLTHNVLKVPCESGIIREAIRFQSKRKFGADYLYYKRGTARKIAMKIKEILQ